ncbi:PrpF domain-containing protein [Achromobacter xylosoxidans]
MVDPARVPRDGIATIRIWQANIGKTIIAHVPMTNGEVQETGDFELDGVTFPAAELQLEFMDPTRTATAARCSQPASWWTTWTCRAWAPSRPP